jgi:hypothetical protein
VWHALGALSPSDFAWSAMVNPQSIRLINSIKMDLSSASNAANNAVDDGGITGIDSAIDSPPRIRQNQRLKRRLSQLTHGDDGDPKDELFRLYQESTVAHRLVHSSDRVRRRLQAILDGREEEQSQFLFTQPPDGLPLTPNQHRSVIVSKLFLMVEKRNNRNSSSLNLRMAFRSHQTNIDDPMPDDEHEIILDGR